MLILDLIGIIYQLALDFGVVERIEGTLSIGNRVKVHIGVAIYFHIIFQKKKTNWNYKKTYYNNIFK